VSLNPFSHQVACFANPELERRMAIEKQMDEAVKGPKKVKKRKNDHDLERMDDEALENLRLAMVEAAERDADCVEAGQPAVHKLGMLDDVRALLSRQNLLSVALDGQILTGIRRWLEPLPNRSLPAYNVQKLMFEILAKLKPHTEHLRESGIGKIVTFYTKDVRPELHIRREAEKLVRDWTRPILGRSDDYHSREVPMSGRGGDSRPRPKQARRDNEPNPLAQAPRNTGRARVPLPASQSYEIAPQSRVIQGHNQFARPAGAAGDDWIRRMKGKKQKKGLA
jgi:transcription factor SPN1